MIGNFKKVFKPTLEDRQRHHIFLLNSYIDWINNKDCITCTHSYTAEAWEMSNKTSCTKCNRDRSLALKTCDNYELRNFADLFAVNEKKNDNVNKLAEISQKKKWLVYLSYPCEMGSEGNGGGWMYHCVAFGNSDEEIYKNWIENVKKIYEVDLSKDLKLVENRWYCYYPLNKVEFPTSNGDNQDLHIDSF